MTERMTGNAQEMLKRTICLSVSVSKWGNSHKVRKGLVQADADEDMYRVSKKLLRSAEYEAIVSFDNSTYAWLYDVSMPSMFKRGIYRIRLDKQPEVEFGLRELSAKRKALVDAFSGSFLTVVDEEMPATLRALFDRSDYPQTPEAMSAKFAMAWYYPADLQIADSLARVDPETYARQQEQRQVVLSQIWEETRGLLRQRVADLVTSAASIFDDRADGKKKSIREDCVAKWQEFWKVFDAQDLTDDQLLRELVERGKALTTGVTAEAIRTDASLREKLSGEFAALKEQAAALAQDAPVRFIRFDEE